MPSAEKASSAASEHEFRNRCFGCGALVSDQVKNPWGAMPWIVTKRESGGIRFLIDGRDEDNPDVFTGFAMSVHGKLAKLRYAFHRSHFEEELPD
jgi:hypothetical protein